MSSALANLPGTGRFARGLHPPGRKALAADSRVEVIPTPPQVLIPLLQHTGAACDPLVKPRQEVLAGQKIGDNDAFICAPVHSPIAGTTARLSVATLPNGRHVRAIPIKAEGDQLTGEQLWEDTYGGDWPNSDLERFTPSQIVDAVRQGGIVGLGGAAFPTHVKLTANPARPIDTLLVNGCECEPYLTADDRIMRQAPDPIVTGALLAGIATGAERVVIAIEDNKPEAAESMQSAAAGTQIQVAVVKTKYPMGGERQVIPAVLKLQVPTGGLPLDIGVVVINVATAAALARAVLRSGPLTHRIVTISGAGVANPKNLLVPIGISYAELIEYCGGLTPDAARVIAGGPMMGFALSMDNLKSPVTKGTSGLTVLTADDVRRMEETRCIRCGRCVDTCPLNLVATRLATAARDRDWELARKYYITACCECGCCAYVCPAGIPLTQLIRMGKAEIPRD